MMITFYYKMDRGHGKKHKKKTNRANLCRGDVPKKQQKDRSSTCVDLHVIVFKHIELQSAINH